MDRREEKGKRGVQRAKRDSTLGVRVTLGSLWGGMRKGWKGPKIQGAQKVGSEDVRKKPSLHNHQSTSTKRWGAK